MTEVLANLLSLKPKEMRHACSCWASPITTQKISSSAHDCMVRQGKPVIMREKGCACSKRVWGGDEVGVVYPRENILTLKVVDERWKSCEKFVR